MKRIAENSVARYFILNTSQVFAFNRNLHITEENIKNIIKSYMINNKNNKRVIVYLKQ